MKSTIGLLLLFSTAAFAADSLAPLRSTDKLAQMVSAVSTRMSDENISGCGMSQAKAFAVRSGEIDWLRTGEVLLQETYGSDFKSKKAVRVEFLASIEPAIVAEAVDALMVANDYNPKAKDIRRQLSRTVWAMLRKLQIDSDSFVITAEANVSSSCGQQNVQSFLFVNSNTNKAVQIFAAQGFM